MSGFSSYMPISIADYERWKRLKTQFQDFNPALLEVGKIQAQIAGVQNDKSMSLAEKFRVKDNLQARAQRIVRDLPLGNIEQLVASLSAKKSISAPETVAAATTPAGEPIPIRAGNIIDTSSFEKIQNVLGDAKDKGIAEKDEEQYNEVLQLMANNSSAIGVDSKRRIVINGKPIPGSIAEDLVAHLFKDRKTQSTEGLKNFIQALHKLGAHQSVFKTKRVKGHLARIGALQQHSAVGEEEEDWVETASEGEATEKFQSILEHEPQHTASLAPVSQLAPPRTSTPGPSSSIVQAKGTTTRLRQTPHPRKDVPATVSKKSTQKGKGHGKKKFVRLARKSSFPPGKRTPTAAAAKKKQQKKPRAPKILRLYV